MRALPRVPAIVAIGAAVLLTACGGGVAAKKVAERAPAPVAATVPPAPDPNQRCLDFMELVDAAHAVGTINPAGLVPIDAALAECRPVGLTPACGYYFDLYREYLGLLAQDEAFAAMLAAGGSADAMLAAAGRVGEIRRLLPRAEVRCVASGVIL